VAHQLLDRAAKFRVHQQWYLTTAMDALLGTDSPWREKNRLVSLHGSRAGAKQDLFCGCARSGPICFKRNSKCCSTTLTSTLLRGRDGREPQGKYGHSRE